MYKPKLMDPVLAPLPPGGMPVAFMRAAFQARLSKGPAPVAGNLPSSGRPGDSLFSALEKALKKLRD